MLCHIDDTNIVPELNDRNHLGRLHIDPKEASIPAPKPPVHKPRPKPTPRPTPKPIPTPVPPVCEERKEYVCEETLHRERKDTYMSDLGLDIPAHLEHIKQYRIQRNNGTRSKRYTPGQDDIDPKWEGCDPDVRYFVPPTHCQRRMRAYFGDHTYEIKTCERESETVCTPGKPVYTPPVKPEPTPIGCKRNDCDFVELPSIDL